MNNSTKLMLGVLAGAAVGFALGMVLAPKKGSDLRQGIMDSLEDIGDKVTDLVEEGREKLSELTNFGMSPADGTGDLAGNAPQKQAVS